MTIKTPNKQDTFHVGIPTNIGTVYNGLTYYINTIDESISVSIRNRGFEKVSREECEKNGIIFDSPDYKLPKRMTAKSAGYDIFSPIHFKLEPNEEIKIATGVKAYMNPNEYLMITPRSGLGFKYYCRLANTVGIGDSDYYNNPDNEGDYFLKIRNEGNSVIDVKAGMAIAQAIFQSYLLVDDDDFNGNKRVGGLGSTT